MLGPVRQEWRRVETPHHINNTSSEQANIYPASVSSDSAMKGSAKAQLHQLCGRELWKHPVYECCNDEGPPHHKLFTFKVLLNIEGASTTTLECFGNPRTSKKAAAEDAAEGALWCLKQMGYQL